MVGKRDSSTAAVGPSHGPVLPQITVVFGPELVLSSVAVVVSEEGVAGVVRWVVLGEGLNDVELDARVAGKAVEGKVRVSLGIVVGGVVDYAGRGLVQMYVYVCHRWMCMQRTGFCFHGSLFRRQSFLRRPRSSPR